LITNFSAYLFFEYNHSLTKNDPRKSRNKGARVDVGMVIGRLPPEPNHKVGEKNGRGKD
jgi:hypothetical protein